MGGDRRPPAGRDRAIGAQLRAVRLRYTRWSLEQSATEIGWSLATLSRTENGRRHISSEDVATILAIYRVPRPLRDRMIEDARVGTQTGWWSGAMPGVLPDVGALASYEVDAQYLTDWSVTLVPGLLQTRDYAVAYMLSDGIDPADVEARWEARQRRQEAGAKLDYTAFIHEHVLHSPFGGTEAFRAQLQHLRDAPDRGLGVRLVRSVDAALMHSWLLIEFARASPIVHIELMRSSLFLYDEEVERYRAIREKIARSALSAADTRQVIARVIERL